METNKKTFPNKGWKHCNVDVKRIYDICNQQRQTGDGDGFISKKACLEIFFLHCLKDSYLNNKKDNACHKIMEEYQKA